MLEILSVFSTVQCSCIYIGAQHAESATRVHTGPKARWGLLGLYTTHKAYITKLVCVDGIEWQSPPSVLICSGNPCVVNILSTCGTTAAALVLWGWVGLWGFLWWAPSGNLSLSFETETETSLFNTKWHYTDAWYQTYMTVLMYYSVLTWYHILACMLGDLC